MNLNVETSMLAFVIENRQKYKERFTEIFQMLALAGGNMDYVKPKNNNLFGGIFGGGIGFGNGKLN